MDTYSSDVVRRLSAAERALNRLRAQGWVQVACDQFLRLAGLRGSWPMSAFDSTGAAQDQSGHAHHLTYNGNPTYNYYGCAPYIALDGIGDYLSRADEADLDILGTESYVGAQVRGMTAGGWFRVSALPGPGAYGGLVSKNGAALQRSWSLRVNNATPELVISDDGTNTTTCTSMAIVIDTWYFIVGRFIPSTSVDVFVNEVEYNQVTARAALFNSNAALQVGYCDVAGSYLTGWASMVFVCAMALSDACIQSLYQVTRSLLDV